MVHLSWSFALVSAFCAVAPVLCTSHKIRAQSENSESLNRRQESCASTQTAEGASDIVADISGLPNTINSIKNEFQQVSEQLAALAASGVADAQSVGSAWNLNLQSLEAFLDSAASTATSFVSELDNFIAVVIPQTNELLNNGDFTDSTSLIQEFEDTAQNFANQAQQVINNLQSAQADMNILAAGVQTLSDINGSTTLFLVTQSIVSQLNPPMDIWNAVISDNGEGITIITGILDLLLTAPGDVPSIFLDTVSNAVCFYEVMIPTLRNFNSAAQNL